MAGAKKKKKPAANPARGFATTSIASKARIENGEGESSDVAAPDKSAPPSGSVGAATPPSTLTTAKAPAASTNVTLTPEQFEQQLEEDELQLIVEKYAQKSKRDAQRQRTRLETDRRLLRAQADAINSRKWLPPELMSQILDMIQAESRFASSSVSAEHLSAGKMLPEEDMTIKLWTLQQTLAGAGFPADRVKAALQYILDISPSIPAISKDVLWGLEEALDWLARECPITALPDYDSRGRREGKHIGMDFISFSPFISYVSKSTSLLIMKYRDSFLSYTTLSDSLLFHAANIFFRQRRQVLVLFHLGQEHQSLRILTGGQSLRSLLRLLRAHQPPRRKLPSHATAILNLTISSPFTWKRK
jgi:hypothetical protein